MKNLSRHLTLIFVLVSFSVSSVISGLSVVTSHLHSVEVLERARDSAAQIAAESMAFPLKIGDIHSVQNFAEGFYRNNERGIVVVSDADGIELFRIPGFSQGEVPLRECQADMRTAFIMFEGGLAGKLSYCFTAPAFRIFSKDIVFGLLLFLVLNALFLGISWFIRSRTKEASFILEQIQAIDVRAPKFAFESEMAVRPETRAIVHSVQELVAELIRASEEASRLKLNESVAKIATQVSHDIRSPLAALNIVVKSLVDTPREKAELMIGAIKRINGIAEELLRHSKGQAQHQHGIIETARIEFVLDSVVKEKRTQYSNLAGVEFIADVQLESGREVHGSEIEFARVVSNLINNSVEAMIGSGTIKLSARDYSDSVEVTVTDSGKGIPNEVIAKVGVRGYSHGKFGNGLGLSYAYEVIESYGGKVHIQSKAGVGTMITLSIPKVS